MPAGYVGWRGLRGEMAVDLVDLGFMLAGFLGGLAASFFILSDLFNRRFQQISLDYDLVDRIKGELDRSGEELRSRLIEMEALSVAQQRRLEELNRENAELRERLSRLNEEVARLSDERRRLQELIERLREEDEREELEIQELREMHLEHVRRIERLEAEREELMKRIERLAEEKLSS
ncbi:hypothetical protein B6U99_06645 [Candidatus Geothermarchaeota archaeon ex4572_27]|nr:MAG: hypothetical protein B6U99_06645 [Candidatus Geothermarchaeota archaeon ex4572_27]